ncbi:unnamed protein product [Didymodactylos carnosus]|uniref:EF-hand domain-containing protein n=1 Tax=Didymodactylos carnosus TaxID=1234261 RepID=A0A813ZGB9_9BILA|nr:unnamed protein product [Didymodactylos carnosus]CAF3681561.1 unnamed protein product [Didymodactylos carnosus]
MGGKQSILDEEILKDYQIEELHSNPFNDRIIDVFSSNKEDGSFTFEDFLDMMSVFSENAPKSVKINYAYKIYQGISKTTQETTNEDAIDLKDIEEIIFRLSGRKINKNESKRIANSVINEVDLRNDKKITAEIFEYFLSNVPDFPTTFCIPLSDGVQDTYTREEAYLPITKITKPTTAFVTQQVNEVQQHQTSTHKHQHRSKKRRSRSRQGREHGNAVQHRSNH